ncbi:E3 ubiquitin-protein ligase [Colletotrichum orbiculare MAFF 240422]|uniref:E3 ubiquitin-protein ligase n=1 Tax=Colletotrichum orbiculare (strain 104-T / ATCC 96160 / CBS 514.97 / LARS 414 / MAFF 240422) TaxID=1213857 RepID=A0A484G6E1_COLOR|nr:E3 ubiquitin-protein ligase [Colletotrichum orbiculare MAFF 240422]
MVFTKFLGSSPDMLQHAHPKPSTSAVSASKAHDTISTDTAEAAPRNGYIYDESHLRPLPSDCPDLRELNNSLDALAGLFPDVQIQVFREMLINFEEESRLAVVADALLKNRVAWVKGRWLVSDDHRLESSPSAAFEEASISRIPRVETFRSSDYKKAVQALAWHEFKGLSRSTINAVLAESNYSYLDARKTLVSLCSKSWRFTISSLFLRRKPVATGEAENHPLVIWKSTGLGAIVPLLKATGNAELDRELYRDLIQPLREQGRQSQVDKDRGLAALLNNEEAEAAEAMHECTCCFTDYSFEEFTTCNADGHMLCFRCVQQSVREAVFGQGWQSSIDIDSGSLKCLAVEAHGCPGHVPHDHLHRAMLEEKRGAEILHRLDQRLAENSLLASSLPLVRCPFCAYAEVDDIYLPANETPLQIRVDSLVSLMLMVVCTAIMLLLLPAVLLSFLSGLLLSTKQTLGDQLLAQWSNALGRYRRRRRGLMFTCQNPGCGRSSCLSCSKSWTDIHVCNESSLVALRTQVEQAMSMAIKRVCPRCHTSFVKNSGCNKLTCPCGYKMCYVCRKDIGGSNGEGEGYRHFCEHFRPDGDPRPCTECTKCNLWESEDTDLVLRLAKEEAESKWRQAEKRDLSGPERAFLEAGFGKNGTTPVHSYFQNGRLPTVVELCDFVVETVFI